MTILIVKLVTSVHCHAAHAHMGKTCVDESLTLLFPLVKEHGVCDESGGESFMIRNVSSRAATMLMLLRQQETIASDMRPLLCIAFFGLTFCAASAQSANEPSHALSEALAKGDQALQAGANNAAEQEYRSALALAPDSVEILNNLAISLARQSKEDEAIAIYERALKLKPGDAVTERNLGVAYFRSRRYKDALPLLKSFAASKPSFISLNLTGVALFALDDYSAAADYLERASVFQPNDLPTLDILGKAYWRAKNYAGVTQVFDRIMAIDAKSPEAHFMLGLAYDLKYREAEARKEFEAILVADPKYPGLHSSLGHIDWREHKVADAKREFEEELREYPNDPVSNYMVGEILRQENKAAEAVPYLQVAVAANPNYRDALIALGECRMVLHQPQQAIAPLRKATEVDPDFAQAHFVLGNALRMTGDTAGAAEERKICGELQAKQHAELIRKTRQDP